MPVDLRATLPRLLPAAITWAEAQAARAASSGRPLTDDEAQLARRAGVAHTERVRVALVDALPLPEEAELREAAIQAELFGPNMVGLTLGHSVFIRRGHETKRLLSHELRHVHQCEQAGSLAHFLPGYLQQIVEFGYAAAPLEQDARAHETVDG